MSMRTRTQSPLDEQRSRLDEPPVARRDFLGLAGLWTALAALGVASLGLLRMPKAALLPTPSKKFTVRPPATVPPEGFVPPGRNLAFYRDAGGAYAISLVCTHLGCIVKPEANGFECPCHGSVFGKDGAVIAGPAPKGLPWRRVEARDDGTFLVDEGETVPVGTRVAVAQGDGPGDES